MSSERKAWLREFRYYPEPVLVVFLYGVLFAIPTLEQYLFMVFSKEVGYNYTVNANTANSDCSPDDQNSTSHVLLKEVRLTKFLHFQYKDPAKEEEF